MSKLRRVFRSIATSFLLLQVFSLTAEATPKYNVTLIPERLDNLAVEAAAGSYVVGVGYDQGKGSAAIFRFSPAKGFESFAVNDYTSYSPRAIAPDGVAVYNSTTVNGAGDYVSEAYRWDTAGGRHSLFAPFSLTIGVNSQNEQVVFGALNIPEPGNPPCSFGVLNSLTGLKLSLCFGYSQPDISSMNQGLINQFGSVAFYYPIQGKSILRTKNSSQTAYDYKVIPAPPGVNQQELRPVKVLEDNRVVLGLTEHSTSTDQHYLFDPAANRTVPLPFGEWPFETFVAMNARDQMVLRRGNEGFLREGNVDTSFYAQNFTTSAWQAFGPVTITESGSIVSQVARVSDGSVHMAILTPQSDNCLGDLNGDGVVNVLDLSRFLLLFGAPLTDDRADLNFDGVINTADLSKFLSRFGSKCPRIP